MSKVKVPAHLEPYVDALGIEDAVHLFLGLGGSQIYLPKRSTPRSQAARTIGAENVDKLAERLGYGYIKVPLARQWVAQVMAGRGDGHNDIARTIRCDVATVRRWLGPASSQEQLNLF